jgi:hypothetical protein
MDIKKVIYLFIFLFSVGCGRSDHNHPLEEINQGAVTAFVDSDDTLVAGGLLLTKYQGLDDFKKDIEIIFKCPPEDSVTKESHRGVRLIQQYKGRTIVSELNPGVSEEDFVRARDGSLWDKASMAMKSPYALVQRNNLVTIEILGRRRYRMFGEGDIAFYDLALAMNSQIVPADTLRLELDDMGEKGFINTFNHVTAQVFMTLLYNERLADFVADVHERKTMPELISGRFTEKQLADLKNGPVDNYVDMLNNEWGQEIGKYLKAKYRIAPETAWTPDLLAAVLNDILIFQSRAFEIGFVPFTTSDDVVVRFTHKLNTVLTEVSDLQRRFY